MNKIILNAGTPVIEWKWNFRLYFLKRKLNLKIFNSFTQQKVAGLEAYNILIEYAGDKVKRWISKRVFQENKPRQTFRVSGGKKYLFFRNFEALCFLETPVLRFSLLPYYRRFVVFIAVFIQLDILDWFFVGASESAKNTRPKWQSEMS